MYRCFVTHLQRLFTGYLILLDRSLSFCESLWLEGEHFHVSPKLVVVISTLFLQAGTLPLLNCWHNNLRSNKKVKFKKGTKYRYAIHLTDRLLWLEADFEKTAVISVLILGHRHTMHQYNACNLLYLYI